MNCWREVRDPKTNIHVTVLSKFPFAARRSHSSETYPLSGRRLSVSRGIADVEVSVSDR